MDARLQFLAFVFLNQALTTAIWWVAGTWLGMSRKAARHWMLAGLANGTGLTLTVVNGGWQNTAQMLMAGFLVTLGCVSLRRGMQAFLRIPHTDKVHGAVLVGLALFNLGICGPLSWRAAGMVAGGLTACWMLAACARETFNPIRREYSASLAHFHNAIMASSMAVFLGVVVTAAFPDVYWPWYQFSPEAGQFTLVFACVSLAIVSSGLLMYFVVMRLVQRLEHLSRHDALTGLLNRRAIEGMLDREVQRLQRFGETFTVLMVDIDHFKRVNDRLGHAAGDAVLCAVARTLEEQAREVDRVARYGGEEFCVLLPHTQHEGAVQAAERLREAISQVNIPWNDTTISVTVSTGMACALDTKESLSGLLRRADEALYRAKAEGRNRVVVSELMRCVA
ncbi:MAG: GGDEF domain-containing protein [Burkholderiales bacterium]|nr:GGDEF domain-containing protein [Burkholderiales bacterium]